MEERRGKNLSFQEEGEEEEASFSDALVRPEAVMPRTKGLPANTTGTTAPVTPAVVANCLNFVFKAADMVLCLPRGKHED